MTAEMLAPLRFGQALRRMSARLARITTPYRLRVAVAELEMLDDRIPRDMGVSRNEINGLVRGNLARSATTE